MASRLRDFMRMNPPMYFGSKIDEDPQDFLDEVYKILFVMVVSTTKKTELATFQLKDVAQTWYNQWKKIWDLKDGPVLGRSSKSPFLTDSSQGSKENLR